MLLRVLSLDEDIFLVATILVLLKMSSRQADGTDQRGIIWRAPVEVPYGSGYPTPGVRAAVDHQLRHLRLGRREQLQQQRADRARRARLAVHEPVGPVAAAPHRQAQPPALRVHVGRRQRRRRGTQPPARPPAPRTRVCQAPALERGRPCSAQAADGGAAQLLLDERARPQRRCAGRDAGWGA